MVASFTFGVDITVTSNWSDVIIIIIIIMSGRHKPCHRTASVKSIESLGNSRRRLLDNSTEGEAFQDRLHQCSRSLFPPFGESSSFLDANTYLEKRWQDIVDSVGMSDQQISQQSALWEFITTERTYICRVNIIVKLFIGLFDAVRDEGDLHDVDKFEIFANITDIMRANERFWTDFIYPSLEKTRSDKGCFVPSNLFQSNSTVFSFKDFFQCYDTFCLRQKVCMKYILDLRQPKPSGNTKCVGNLKSWLRWCENLAQADGFKWEDLLNEPHIRLCRYVILLTQILKNTTEEGELEFVRRLLNECKSFVTGIDNQLLEEIKYKDLVLWLNQIEDFTFTEAEEVHTNIDCTLAINFLRLPIQTLNMPAPRYILDTSDMKLIKGKKRWRVKTFFFSDVFCLTKVNSVTGKYQIITPMYFIDKVQFVKSKRAINVIVMLYLDECGLLADTLSLEVDPKEMDNWLTLFERAKLCYKNTVEGKGATLDFFKNGNISPCVNTNEDISPCVNTNGDISPCVTTNEDIAPCVNTNEDISPCVNTNEDIAPCVNTNEDISPCLVANNGISPCVNTNEDISPCVNTNEDISPCVNTNEDISPCVNTNEDISPCVNTNEDIAPCVNTNEDISPCLVANNDISPCVNTNEDISPCVITNEDISPCVITNEDIFPCVDTNEDISPCLMPNVDISACRMANEDITTIVNTQIIDESWGDDLISSFDASRHTEDTDDSTDDSVPLFNGISGLKERSASLFSLDALSDEVSDAVETISDSSEDMAHKYTQTES